MIMEVESDSKGIRVFECGGPGETDSIQLKIPEVFSSVITVAVNLSSVLEVTVLLGRPHRSTRGSQS